MLLGDAKATDENLMTTSSRVPLRVPCPCFLSVSSVPIPVTVPYPCSLFLPCALSPVTCHLVLSLRLRFLRRLQLLRSLQFAFCIRRAAETTIGFAHQMVRNVV
jgi:hypothetical protein